MRILFISAYYPPHEIGGWPQLTHDVNQGLQDRGHVTYVLTSRHGLPRPALEDGIARVLYPEADINHYRPLSMLDYKRRLNWNLNKTKEVIRSFQPDVVSVHAMWNLTRGVPWLAEQLLPGRVVHYLASVVPYQDDPHVAYWRDPGRHPVRSFGKRLLAAPALRLIENDLTHFQLSFDHVLCVSWAAADAIAHHLNRDPQSIPVVYNGVELDRFHPGENWGTERGGSAALSILFAGNLVAHKGAHTIIEAMAGLARHDQSSHLTLAIAGRGHPDYERRLRDQVQSAGLGNRIRFLGLLPRDQMPALMRQYDVFVLPSIWEEPLARVIQEAMATGLIVIGTNTGGTGELLVDGQTGLVFPPGDAQALAERIRLVVKEPLLARQLAEAGRRAVIEKFSLDRMIDQIEHYLEKVVNDSPTL